MINLTIAMHEVDSIFPANIIVAEDFTVVRVGPAIARRYPQISQMHDLRMYFETSAADADGLREIITSSGNIYLDDRSSKTRYFGPIVKCESGFLLALRIRLESYYLDDEGLEISDFPADDPAIHGLLLFNMQRAMIEEQKLMSIDLAKQRQKASDLAERFQKVAAYVAHDFNNILSIVEANCDRLLAQPAQDVPTRSVLNMIRESALRGGLITKSLMLLGRQRNDLGSAVSIDHLLKDNANFVSSIVGKEVALDLRLGSEGWVVKAGALELWNNLINVLMNSRDAMPGGGRVTISTSIGHRSGQDGTGYVTIEVADTGVGMEPEILARALEPLFSTKSQGTGLGLASVADFARDYGGQIRIKSTPGLGTQVYLSLPAVRVKGAQRLDRAASGAASPDRPAGSLKVLLVDDEPYALEALAELLEGEGHSVRSGHSVTEAKTALDENDYDVLVTDIVMPDGCGVELAHEASAHDARLKIIVMSGFLPSNVELDKDWCFVRKPIDSARLIAALNEIATA